MQNRTVPTQPPIASLVRGLWNESVREKKSVKRPTSTDTQTKLKKMYSMKERRSRALGFDDWSPMERTIWSSRTRPAMLAHFFIILGIPDLLSPENAVSCVVNRKKTAWKVVHDAASSVKGDGRESSGGGHDNPSSYSISSTPIMNVNVDVVTCREEAWLLASY